MGSSNLFDTWFNFLFYFCLLNGALSFLEIAFFIKFINKASNWYHYLMYVSIMYFVYAMEIQMRVPFAAATILELAALFGFGCLILRCSPILSAITTILTITIMQVINGIFQSITNIISSLSLPHAQYISLFLNFLVIVAIFFAYRFVIKSFCIRNTPMIRYVLILLLPIIFVLIVIQHIFSTYINTDVIYIYGGRLPLTVNHLEMLLIQLAAFCCLMAVLFAYRKLSEAYELKIKSVLMEQQISAQKDYMQEVQTRYEHTRSFRHDIKNHGAVLQRLLKDGETQKALEYLKKLDNISDTLSFPCQSGNTFVDTLLSNKLGLAQQIGAQVDCTVKIPDDSSIDDMDLCIVFSNAIDNAIRACNSIKIGSGYIKISAVQKGKLLMVEFQNSQSEQDSQKKGFGIGLNNIKAVAEKYNGTISVESNKEFFKLSVLFIISQHPKSN